MDGWVERWIGGRTMGRPKLTSECRACLLGRAGVSDKASPFFLGRWSGVGVNVVGVGSRQPGGQASAVGKSRLQARHGRTDSGCTGHAFLSQLDGGRGVGAARGLADAHSARTRTHTHTAHANVDVRRRDRGRASRFGCVRLGCAGADAARRGTAHNHTTTHSSRPAEPTPTPVHLLLPMPLLSVRPSIYHLSSIE